MYYFEHTKKLIEKYNIAAESCMKCYQEQDKKDIEILENIDIEMAKAMVADWDKMAVRVAKIILAHHDIESVKIKIESE